MQALSPEQIVLARVNDSDSNGLTTCQEFELGTDPSNSDSDGDGVGDAVEVDVEDDAEVAAGTAPNNAADDIVVPEVAHLTGGKVGGCSATNASGTPTGIGFRLIRLGMMAFRRRGRKAAAMAITLAALTAPVAVAQAQSAPGFDAQSMTPGPGRSTSFWSQPYASRAGHLRWDDGVFMNHARKPLVLRNASGDADESFISDQLTLHLLGLLGVTNHFDIGVDIPMILLSEGDELVNYPGLGSEGSFGIGDIRFQDRHQ